MIGRFVFDAHDAPGAAVLPRFTLPHTLTSTGSDHHIAAISLQENEDEGGNVDGSLARGGDGLSWLSSTITAQTMTAEVMESMERLYQCISQPISSLPSSARSRILKEHKTSMQAIHAMRQQMKATKSLLSDGLTSLYDDFSYRVNSLFAECRQRESYLLRQLEEVWKQNASYVERIQRMEGRHNRLKELILAHQRQLQSLKRERQQFLEVCKQLRKKEAQSCDTLVSEIEKLCKSYMALAGKYEYVKDQFEQEHRLCEERRQTIQGMRHELSRVKASLTDTKDRYTNGLMEIRDKDETIDDLRAERNSLIAHATQLETAYVRMEQVCNHHAIQLPNDIPFIQPLVNAHTQHATIHRMRTRIHCYVWFYIWYHKHWGVHGI